MYNKHNSFYNTISIVHIFTIFINYKRTIERIKTP